MLARKTQYYIDYCSKYFCRSHIPNKVTCVTELETELRMTIESISWHISKLAFWANSRIHDIGYFGKSKNYNEEGYLVNTFCINEKRIVVV